MSSAGTVILNNAQDPFGNPNAATTLSLSNFRYPGQYFEAETALNQNWYRDYDPKTGRYLQSDPIGIEGGTDTYSYSYGNPLSFTDPMGLQVGLPGLLPFPGTLSTNAAAGRAIARQVTRALSDDDNGRQKTYQTYTRYNPLTGQCYTGRTSGYRDAITNVRYRNMQQRDLNDEGFLPGVLDRSSYNPDSIRGREQQVIDINGGARSAGGTSRNLINGISIFNPKRSDFLAEATQSFGLPIRAGNCTCQP